VCDDWAAEADHGRAWPTRILACKDDVVARARLVQDLARELADGAGRAAEPLDRRPPDPRLGRVDHGTSAGPGRAPRQRRHWA